MVREPVLTVIVDVPEPGAAIEEGTNIADTPFGSPDTDKEMAELKPPETAVVIVELPVLPQLRLIEVGAAAMLKSPPPGVVVTVKETVVVCVTPPPVPVTVMV